MSETVKPNLYQKLLSITEEIGKIEKTGTNTGVGAGYKFIEQAVVVSQVRVQLAKHGVMIIPETVSRTMERYIKVKPGYKQGDPPVEQATFHANVTSRYTLVNADNPTETMVCEWDAGEALDTSDKATNKATTASHKSFLMKLFNISDKDDPDAHSPEAVGKGIDYNNSPAEPSRQVTDEPISNLSMIRAKQAFRDKNPNLNTTLLNKYVEFSESIIGKPSPTTEADAVKLIAALEAE